MKPVVRWRHKETLGPDRDRWTATYNGYSELVYMRFPHPNRKPESEDKRIMMLLGIRKSAAK